MKNSKLSLNPHLVFIGLCLLAIIRPFSLANANRYIGMLLFLLLCLLSIYYAIKNTHQLKKYTWEIALLALFLITNLVSIQINLSHYQNAQQLVFYAFSSLAVFSAWFLSWWIFQQNNTHKYAFTPWIFIFCLALVALIQIIDYPHSIAITQYFVSAESIRPNEQIISSLFRWHTIYAVVAAIGIISLIHGLLDSLLQNRLKKGDSTHRIKIILSLMLVVLLFYTGLLGQSRNFLLVLTVGLTIILFNSHFSKRWIFSSLLLLILSVHILLLNKPQLRQDYAQILPYINKIAQYEVPQARDFIPQINNDTLTDRVVLWQQGIQLWQQQPWWGIGTGAFRAMHADDQQQRNLHNYYLQVLVENGWVGFFILCVLMSRLIWRAHQAQNLTIFVSILSSLLFDHYLDYSFAWVFMMVWFLYSSNQIVQIRQKPST